MGGRTQAVVEERGRDNYPDCPAFESLDCPILTNRTVATTSRSGTSRLVGGSHDSCGHNRAVNPYFTSILIEIRKFLGTTPVQKRLETLKDLLCKGLNLLGHPPVPL